MTFLDVVSNVYFLVYVIGVLVFWTWFVRVENEELGWFQNLFCALAWPILVCIVLGEAVGIVRWGSK